MSGAIARLEAVRRAVGRLEDAILALLLTGMILLAAAQILLRNLFSFGFSWGEPLLRTLVLWLALLGAMAATRDANHIRIDVLARFLPEWAHRLARRLTDLFSVLVCALAAWHTGRFVCDSWHYGDELFAGLPLWAFALIIPLGFGVMALRFLLHAVTGAAPRETP